MQQWLYVKNIIFLCLFGISHIIAAAKAENYLYRTQPGDSLWKIAANHLINISYWQRLIALNHLDNPHYFKPGTIINIPITWLRSHEAYAELIRTSGEVIVFTAQGNPVPLLALHHDHPIQLKSGAKIKTGNNGLAALIFPDGSSLLLQSNSTLTLEKINKLGDGTLVQIILSLQNGNATHNINSRQQYNTQYQVITPLATSSVRGTYFNTHTKNQYEPSITEVLTGKVAVTQPKNKNPANITQGHASIVNLKGQSKRVTLPPAPSFQSAQTSFVQLPITFTIKSQPNIKGYHVLVLPKGENFTSAVLEKTYRSPNIAISHLPQGEYTISIRAIDHQGIMGYPKEHAFKFHSSPTRLLKPRHNAALKPKNAIFQWQPFGNHQYQLDIAKDEQFQTIILNLHCRHYICYPKTNFTTGHYYWRVTSHDANGEQLISPVHQFKVVPQDLSLLTAEQKNHTLFLKWTDLGAQYRYRFQISKQRNFDTILLGRHSSQAHAEINSLATGMYFFRVQAIDHNTEGQWSIAQPFHL